MKNKILFLLFTLFPVYNFAQTERQIEGLHTQLGNYFNDNPVENICLFTDKEVYKPGEIIWFNAWVSNLNADGLASVSTELNVALFHESGEQMINEVYRLSDGTAKGDLVIPDGLAAGRYALVAYTPVTQDEDEIFMKLIFIDPMSPDEVLVDVKTSPALLKAGAGNLIELSLSELSGKARSSGKLSFELLHGEQLLLKDKLKSEPNGSLRFNLDVPSQSFDRPLRLKIYNSKNLLYSKLYQVNTGKLLVRFFAEGGQLVAGTPLKIGYRVTNSLGQPVSIEADILEKGAGALTQTKTFTAGFGVFPFNGKTNTAYQLKITGELGNGQVFDLPAFDPDGFTFSIQKTDEDFIYANLVFTNGETRSVNLMATRGSRLFWASPMEVAGAVRVKIPKDNLPNGICMLSVFNPDDRLMADRLVYVDKRDQLKLSIETEKETVQAGKKFELKIKSRPESGEAMPGIMTVSVAADPKILKSPDDPLCSFGLNDLLEYPVPGLSQMIADGTFSENSLNYLLICNRFKNFSWDTVLGFDRSNYLSEQGENWLSGLVLNKYDEPVPNAKVNLLNTSNVRIMNVTTDANGYFVFTGIGLAELDKYVVKAIDAEGNDKLTVAFDGNTGEKLARQVKRFMIQTASWEKPKVDSRFYQENSHLFSKMKKPAVKAPSKDENYRKMLSSGSSILDVIKMIKPYQLDGDKIIFPGGQNSLMAQDGALIVIDGQKMGTSASAVNSISPTDVESINVSTSPIDIQRYTGLNSVGLIEIRTKRGEIVPEVSEVEENLYADGFRVSRDFSGTVAKSGQRNPTSLYWEPASKFNANEPVNLQVQAGNVTGTFRITVVAVDAAGRTGKAVSAIKVIK
ncbi:carboxypeptidase regulatory-like domain-containing protein [Gaoshiqia sp. Z1-71]|uniref:carboxypeptidase regulatory-like domain-containing protein n=1 Tax=Gaoshiqia hydrogeniformans TaxID=3290090 RepID=UPI003BF8F302